MSDSRDRRTSRVGVGSLLGLLSLGASPAFGAAPLEAYGTLPSIEDLALSPDGTKLAFVRTEEDWRAVEVVELAGDHRRLVALRVGKVKLRRLEWGDDSHVLLTTASSTMPFGLTGERQEWRLMSVVDLNTHRARSLLESVDGVNMRGNGTRTMNVMYGEPVIRSDPRGTIVYLHGIYVENVTKPALFSVNLTTGAEKLLRKGTEATQQWLIDDSGAVVAEEDYFEASRRWEIRLLHDGRVAQSVGGTAAIDVPRMLGLSADGDAVVTRMTEPERVLLRPLSLKDGSWGSDLNAVSPTNVVLHAHGSQRIIGTGFDEDRTTYRFADPALQENWDWAVRRFGGDRVSLVSLTADRSEALVRVFGPRFGYSYQLVHLDERWSEPVGSVYAHVESIAEVRRIDYEAQDGLRIPAYLTLPPGRPPTNLPLILMPHGGPEARDELAFDWWAQALAAQGYAVLQPNFRGSSLSERWRERGYGEWGRRMQTDLSYGLRYLARQGIVDSKRACIVGASYGGYAALAGATLEPATYRCAVAYAGIADLDALLSWTHSKEFYGNRVGLRYLDRFLGVDGAGDKRLEEISPIRHVDQVTIPIMLIHGRDDVTVPYDQSAAMAKALQRAGKAVQFVTLDKEDHFLSSGATRLKMLQTSVAFLRANNPPD